MQIISIHFWPPAEIMRDILQTRFEIFLYDSEWNRPWQNSLSSIQIISQFWPANGSNALYEVYFKNQLLHNKSIKTKLTKYLTIRRK